MRLISLGFAASIAVCLASTPAVAGGPDHFGGHNGPLPDRSGFPMGVGNGHDGDGDGDHQRRNRRGDNIGFWVNGGEWALYNNRSFNSDSYNDWWHDRPDRAYPAWMRNNVNQPNCRLYWAGGGWRC